MPNRSIRDELQGVERNRVKPSDPAQVRAALAGSSPKASSSSSSSSPAVRPDRPAVRGSSSSSLGLTNSGGRTREQKIDQIVDDAQTGK